MSDKCDKIWQYKMSQTPFHSNMLLWSCLC